MNKYNCSFLLFWLLKSINDSFIFMFSIDSDLNANRAKFESRLRFIDCLCGFSIQVKQNNFDSQTAELHPNTSTDIDNCFGWMLKCCKKRWINIKVLIIYNYTSSIHTLAHNCISSTPVHLCMKLQWNLSLRTRIG